MDGWGPGLAGICLGNRSPSGARHESGMIECRYSKGATSGMRLWQLDQVAQAGRMLIADH